MCGITGFVYADLERPAEREVLAKMNGEIVHRGPDADGFHLAGNVGLAMRRLSIIDLSGGDQPIYNEDRTIAVVFNGEIYNFVELRDELEALGHQFATSTDTEVLAHGYEEWGPESLSERLNGMFAFAIWDSVRGVLVLARDRMGKKPLHYCYRPGIGLIFGSEIKSLLLHPEVPQDIDHKSLWHYLSLQATPEPRSAFEAIRKLPPGHMMKWMPSRGRTPAVARYWHPSFEPKWKGTEDELAEQLRDVVTKSVRRRLISDVPLGAFLSGGIDSSIIVGLMAAESDAPVRTFTIGFEEKRFSEAQHARRVAKHFGTEHVEETVRWDVEETLPKIVDAVDEPFADPAALPTYHLSRITRQHVTVALNGDGGDETHAGYQRHLLDQMTWPINWLTRSGASRPAAATWRALSRVVPIRTDIPPERNWALGIRRLAQVMEVGPEASLLRWSSYFSERTKRALATPEFRRLSGAPSTAHLHRRIFQKSRTKNALDATLATDFPLYLASVLLVKADRMTMAHSLEGRSPFLDSEHVDFATKLPADLKLHGRTHKYLLKRAFSKLLPPEITARPKQGFAIPVGEWLRGPLKPMLRDTLLSQTARDRGLFRPREVQRLIREHQAGRDDHGKRLWALLMLELWFQRRVDG
ncbi:asparagine synthase (glutamine-hydrolyzing) [bacterium]|nr:asparagine synthase (glutamine-hydrolyzing) [bacterium]